MAIRHSNILRRRGGCHVKPLRLNLTVADVDESEADVQRRWSGSQTRLELVEDLHWLGTNRATTVLYRLA